MKTLLRIIWILTATAGTGFVLLVACAAFIGVGMKEAENQSTGVAVVEDTSWVPEGFTAFNDNVATRWGQVRSSSCYTDYCYSIEAVSKTGCSSLYIELALSDAEGNNVGYTNDTTSSLRAGEKAILTFNATTGEKARLAKISCY